MARKRERIGDAEPTSAAKPARKPAAKGAKKVKPKPPDVPKPPRRQYRYAGNRPRHGLDEDTIETICKLVAKGVPLSDVMDSLMIRSMEMHRWLKQGEEFQKATEDGVGKKGHEIFADFLIGFKKACGDYAILINGKLHETDDWRCYFKVAERRFPHVYGANPEGGSDQVFSPDDRFL